MYWEDMDRKVTVFLEKDQQRKEVDVEKRIEKGKQRFLLNEKPQRPQEGQEGREGEQPNSTEEFPGIDEVPPEEIQTERMMWLAEKATSLQNENDQMKRVIQEMEAKIALQENAMKEMVERHLREEAAIAYIAEHIQRQEVFNKSAITSINGIVDEIKNHQEGFRGIAAILQVHEQHITVNGAVSQQMAQYVNALIEENEKKTLWIANQMKESQAQREVLLQHGIGQQVLAEMIKWVAYQQQQAQQQQPSQQITAGHGPTVTVVDDEDGTCPGFPGGPSPHAGPPDVGSLSMEIEPQKTPGQTQLETWR